MSKHPKPYVQVAALFEKVLEEKDGVRSLIRMVDIFTVAIPPAEVMTKMPEGLSPLVAMQLVVSLKSAGELVGDYEIQIQLRGPTKTEKPLTVPLTFKEEYTHGVTIKMDVALGVNNFGDCAFEVLWYDEVLAKIPFTLAQGPLVEKPTSPVSPPETDDGAPH